MTRHIYEVDFVSYVEHRDNKSLRNIFQLVFLNPEHAFQPL